MGSALRWLPTVLSMSSLPEQVFVDLSQQERADRGIGVKVGDGLVKTLWYDDKLAIGVHNVAGSCSINRR